MANKTWVHYILPYGYLTLVNSITKFRQSSLILTVFVFFFSTKYHPLWNSSKNRHLNGIIRIIFMFISHNCQFHICIRVIIGCMAMKSHIIRILKASHQLYLLLYYSGFSLHNLTIDTDRDFKLIIWWNVVMGILIRFDFLFYPFFIANTLYSLFVENKLKYGSKRGIFRGLLLNILWKFWF